MSDLDAVDEALRAYGAVLCNGRMPGGRAEGPHYRPLDKHWDPLGEPDPRSCIRGRPATWPGEDIVYSVADPTPTIIRDRRPEGWGVDQDIDLYGAWRQWRVHIKDSTDRLAEVEAKRRECEADGWAEAHPDAAFMGRLFDRLTVTGIIAARGEIERRLVGLGPAPNDENVPNAGPRRVAG